MKKSVAWLTPFIEEEKLANPAAQAGGAGKVLLATVKEMYTISAKIS